MTSANGLEKRPKRMKLSVTPQLWSCLSYLQFLHNVKSRQHIIQIWH